MKLFLNKKILLIFSAIMAISFFANTVFAVWSGTFYEPGDTLNPECLPTDPDCDVRSPLTILNIDDTAYGVSWDADTTHAPSKNAVYDALNALPAGHDAVTLGTANGLSLSTQILSLALASTSTTGALSDTDWNTFNNKVSSQWTTNGSDIHFNTGNVGMGIALPTAKLDILDTTLAGSGSLAGAALNMAQTWNTTGAPTGLKFTITDTASSASSLAMQILGGATGTTNLFKVDKSGILTSPQISTSKVSSSTYAGNGGSNNAPINFLGSGYTFSTADTQMNLAQGTMTQTSGNNYAVKVLPTYNQTSGTAANTDLLINRTETAVGSGSQYLIDAQVGGVSKFSVNNTGRTKIASTDIYTSANYDNILSSSSSGLVITSTGAMGIKTGNSGFQFNYNNSSTGSLLWYGGTNTAKFTVTSTGLVSSTSADSSALTDFLINPTVKTSGSLIDAQVGGVSKFKVEANGDTTIASGGKLSTEYLRYAGTLNIWGSTTSSVAGNAISISTANAKTNTSGQTNVLSIAPIYNQASGTASNTDLLINRTETAVGSGSQYLIDAQVGGVSKFSVNNLGHVQAQRIYSTGFYTNGAATNGFTFIPWGGANLTTGGNNNAFTIGSSNENRLTTGTHTFAKITPYYNQASGTASNTDLLINRTETAVGSGSQYLIDAQVGGVSKFSVSNTGQGYFDGSLGIGITPTAKLHVSGTANITGNSVFGGSLAAIRFLSSGTTTSLRLNDLRTYSTAVNSVEDSPTYTNTSGSIGALVISPTYNQASGTASNTDLLINRTETAVGSGTQLLIDAQVGGVSKFSISSAGAITSSNLISCGGIQTNGSGTMSCTSDERLKNISGDFNTGLSAIMRINPQTYSWKEDSGLYDGGIHYSGFIAQNIEESIPEAVNINPAGYRQVNTTTILATAINAIKELSSTLFSRISEWLADAGNGIKSIFVEKVETKEICVSDETGEKTCITKSQLDALLINAGSTPTLPPPTVGGGAEGEGGNQEDGENGESLTCTAPLILNDAGDDCVDPMEPTPTPEEAPQSEATPETTPEVTPDTSSTEPAPEPESETTPEVSEPATNPTPEENNTESPEPAPETGSE